MAAVWSVSAAKQDATPALSVEALTSALASTALQTESALVASGTSEVEHQAAIVDALEGVIAGSGVLPDVAIDALIAAQSSLRAAGTLSSACNAAFDAIIARIRALQNLEEPAAIGGDTGSPPFGAPPTASAAGGGSDYRTP